MMLIADSGSTKTDWRFIDEDKMIHQFQTSGLNPFFLDDVQISAIIRNELNPDEKIIGVEEIYFYGAGCSSQRNQDLVANGLRSVFTKAKAEINSDLLGACRSLCGKETGTVAILGTGSNSCFFEQGVIAHQVPSLGYLLGDEGSGAYLGKKLLQAFFYKELPENIANRLAERHQLTKEVALDSIYSKPFPSRYLASFAPFIFQNKAEAFISNLVTESFSDFFIHHLCKYPDVQQVPLHCTGSIAYFFGDMLRQVAIEKKIRLGRITEKPIAGLALFHLNQ